ncbi:MAG: DUF4212 domain-containing protein [Deltaproteobacteria bacterium]|nr:DUF4212 domain-containing protein [Deltaproteobacteria bacterium]
MKTNLQEYWQQNLRLMVILLAVWALVSYVFGIALVNQLNAFHLGGFPLGFWFAQQGSIFTFVILIFVYVARMRKLDKKFEVEE